MATLEQTTLTADERVVLERWAQRLRERLGERLTAIWLFGSSARGEPREPADSDVDVLVLVADASPRAKDEVWALLHDAARETGREHAAWSFSVHIDTPAWLAGRRAIRSFFIAEVDRDKVVVEGPR